MHESIQKQFLAALEMMKRAIERCPEALWADPAERNKFWHVAYHALFYVHLYLQPTEAEIDPWPKTREHYQIMGTARLPWPPHDTFTIDQPYAKDDLLEYVEFCRGQVKKQLASQDLTAAESGFTWIPLDKLGLQLYNLRHLQSHTGELAERLWTAAGIEIEWIGEAS